jgi:hypothetical protein
MSPDWYDGYNACATTVTVIERPETQWKPYVSSTVGVIGNGCHAHSIGPSEEVCLVMDHQVAPQANTGGSVAACRKSLCDECLKQLRIRERD